MNRFAALIDPTDFGTIAGYLRQPGTGIHFVLHVPSEDMLATLAEELEQNRVEVPPWEFPEPVARGLREGSIRLSSRYPLRELDERKIVHATDIPRRSLCYVIYAPPFYLSHPPASSRARSSGRRWKPRPATMST